jgi:VWFA-related protein
MDVRVRICLTLGVVGVLLGVALAGEGQAPANAGQDAGTYRLKLGVDEVVLTFDATDADGQPVNDLKASEFKLRDNGVAPRRIVAFDALLDRPLRVQILIDTSESMAREVPRAKLIAERYARTFFRQPSDQASVTPFAYASQASPGSTNGRDLLELIITNVKAGGMNPLPGTAIFKAVFQACFYPPGKVDPTATGNFILLFSDGEDNAGQTTMEEALRACQRSNKVIYAFHFSPQGDDNSTGPKTLADLAAKTGGAVFPADDSDAAIMNDLRMIDSQMRNQYRLAYNPANLRHDGSFHEIDLQPPDRVTRIDVRSGYYAPAQ